MPANWSDCPIEIQEPIIEHYISNLLLVPNYAECIQDTSLIPTNKLDRPRSEHRREPRDVRLLGADILHLASLSTGMLDMVYGAVNRAYDLLDEHRDRCSDEWSRLASCPGSAWDGPRRGQMCKLNGLQELLCLDQKLLSEARWRIGSLRLWLGKEH